MKINLAENQKLGLILGLVSVLFAILSLLTVYYNISIDIINDSMFWSGILVMLGGVVFIIRRIFFEKNESGYGYYFVLIGAYIVYKNLDITTPSPTLYWVGIIGLMVAVVLSAMAVSIYRKESKP